MAWRTPFLTALGATTRAPRFYVETLQVYREPGAAYRVASHLGLGADAVLIGTSSDGGPLVSVQGASLSPRGWKTTIGAFSVGIVGDIAEIHKRWTRGTVLVLYAGFDGMLPEDFEPIGIGQYQNVRGTAPLWTLECWNIDAALRQRLDTSLSIVKAFSLLTSAYLDAAYSVGDTTITVVSTSGFTYETGGSGVIKVGEFYLTYTGTTSTTFTGVSALGKFGTTATSASSGDVVYQIGYLAGHPLDIARKLLCSRDATNGSYDVLPARWGLALTDNLVDHDDINHYRDDVLAVASGSYSWDVLIEAPLEDALSSLSGLLNSAGMFLTVRQGLITVRAGQDTIEAVYLASVEITDADIDTVESYEAFDYTHSPEYQNVRIRAWSASPSSASSPDSEAVATFPADITIEYDLTDRLFTNFTAIADEMISRLEESARRIPERLSLRCAGLRLAQLAPGDVVDFTCTRTHSRHDGALGWDGRRALVVEVSPNWTGGTVRVGLLVYPESGDEFA